jgi:hypothetical protein
MKKEFDPKSEMNSSLNPSFSFILIISLRKNLPKPKLLKEPPAECVVCAELRIRDTDGGREEELLLEEEEESMGQTGSFVRRRTILK